MLCCIYEWLRKQCVDYQDKKLPHKFAERPTTRGLYKTLVSAFIYYYYYFRMTLRRVVCILLLTKFFRFVVNKCEHNKLEDAVSEVVYLIDCEIMFFFFTVADDKNLFYWLVIVTLWCSPFVYSNMPRRAAFAFC